MGEKRFGQTGCFVWHDLMTTDAESAARYYAELLGWRYHEMDMGETGRYRMILAGGLGQGGIVEMEAGEETPPCHWIGYLTVDDVDSAVKQARQLGGKVPVPPRDIPGVGRFAVVADPQGAVFSPFTGGDPDEELPETLPPGVFCWDELLTLDVKSARKFYVALCGWEHEEVDMGETGTYHLLKTGKDRAGMIAMPAEAEGPPAWLPYVLVADVDATRRRVEELGGRIFVPPRDIPGVGRFTVTADPTGAAIAFLST